MDFRKLVTKEQLELALKEVREENWKVDLFIKRSYEMGPDETGVIDIDSNDAFIQYDMFPDRLKEKLDLLLMDKLKIVIRDNKINNILGDLD